MIVKKKGMSDWDDLVGKEIEFEWFDGYDEFPYWFRGVFEGVHRSEGGDIRYPRYYILFEGGGGPSVWEDEEVKVTVHD